MISWNACELFLLLMCCMQVYGPSVSDQSSESTGTALFTRYLSCRLHANTMQTACPGILVTLLPILPCADSHPAQIPILCRFLSCADSHPVQIPTLCRFPCSGTCLIWLPLPSCVDPHAIQMSSCTNLMLLPFYILSKREILFEPDRVVIRPRQCALVS